MPNQTETALLARLADKYGISQDGVGAVFEALRLGGGRMAQFSHADFGGMSQWSSGMTMVGDMFNSGLKDKLNAISVELVGYLRANPERASALRNDDVSCRSGHLSSGADWWPASLGTPSSVGTQNDMRYAVFPETRRLAIDDHGSIKVYDTGDHRVHGIGQAQGSGSTMTFTSQIGLVRVTELAEIS